MKKQYSFRLKNSDEELSCFISELAKQYKNESEAIRQLLLFAYNYQHENKQNELMKQIQIQLEEMKGIQEQYHSQVLKQIENASFASYEVNNDDVEEGDQVAQETAAALISGFGVEF
ncbi:MULTISPECIES: hypothetical protein [Oceanobacillus]|uniref:hypothetical protein n=1 Tax=Oceanobacillus TaxID=182709 RepID=UPI000595CA8E|nr:MULTISPECIES: hypothetical protein [Oceanobacillus]